MPVLPFRDVLPVLHEQVYVAPNAYLIGNVTLYEHASVWFGAVLRGDVEPIVLGAYANIQDNSVVHTDPGFPATIGARTVAGHRVIIHGATIGEGCLIGMGSTLLNGCVIGDECIVGANSLITQGKVFPPRSLIMGSPAKVVREVTDADLEMAKELVERYAKRALEYLALDAHVSEIPRSAAES